LLEPFDGFGWVLGNAFAIHICVTEFVLGGGIALLGFLQEIGLFVHTGLFSLLWLFLVFRGGKGRRERAECRLFGMETENLRFVLSLVPVIGLERVTPMRGRRLRRRFVGRWKIVLAHKQTLPSRAEREGMT